MWNSDLFASFLLDQQNQLLTGTTFSWQTAVWHGTQFSIHIVPSVFTTNNNKHRKRNRKCIFCDQIFVFTQTISSTFIFSNLANFFPSVQQGNIIQKCFPHRHWWERSSSWWLPSWHLNKERIGQHRSCEQGSSPPPLGDSQQGLTETWNQEISLCFKRWS